ncbi:hypothetical protein AJ87_40185 [Rhizobium yanglingense]|nr:hypothetical protein AJ87_40185 [Rhizobium yanglingense]
MRDGYVEQIGSPLELYDRPANLFVAGFVGSPGMNFIKERSALRDHSNSLPMEAPLPVLGMCRWREEKKSSMASVQTAWPIREKQAPRFGDRTSRRQDSMGTFESGLTCEQAMSSP